ncbi:hypothetical protein [Terrihabitans rhizophilus]|uniref:Uncharacterized protein n=1 Tax=Terrihabitans rhizophilus TaxID=3092662 RepID=A0ABU4RR85_9HYPH|nr:hypothetical protein [Terrihabitans sp. PJ23]MDX6806145.1 hypothetical protein [Terrihabitans sp. PJ23]
MSDGGVDPIVRIEANRIRGALSAYYAANPALDELRIELPKGGYIPEFVPRDRPTNVVGLPSATPLQVASSGPRLIWPIGATLLFILILVWAGYLAEPATPPVVELPPLIALNQVEVLGTNPATPALARNLAQAIIADLSQDTDLRVVLVDERMKVDRLLTLNDRSRFYQVSSTIQILPSAHRFWWSVADARRGDIVLSETLDHPYASQGETIESYVSSRIADSINGLVISRSTGSR